jgi:hypothetical protein
VREGLEDSLLRDVVDVRIISHPRLHSPPNSVQVRLNQIAEQVSPARENLTDE